MLKDAGHLFRLAAVFLVGLILFLTVRALLVPKSFGRYGHYRAMPLPRSQPCPSATRATRCAKAATPTFWIEEQGRA